MNHNKIDIIARTKLAIPTTPKYHCKPVLLLLWLCCFKTKSKSCLFLIFAEVGLALSTKILIIILGNYCKWDNNGDTNEYCPCEL